MRFEILFLAAASGIASAQKVVGSAYGFGAGTLVLSGNCLDESLLITFVGATGGGSIEPVTPTTNEELAGFLADETARVILLTKEFDFTGKALTGIGCDRKSCSVKDGGQLYLGDLSCSPGSDIVAVSSVAYNESTALSVGSNKSIIGVDGKGVIKGSGLTLTKNANNVIIQGVKITDINPGVVWGGDALELQGGNTKIWVDHCAFSKVGRQFIVSHYAGASATLSNNEFDGVTSTSASCNGNHYWTAMFIGEDEKFTLDKNYFHDVAGRAPKLGGKDYPGYFHAVNNYFENMKGHAFDAYTGANALVEGNAFVSVEQPSTEQTTTVNTFVANGGSACASALSRNCLANSVDATSGELYSGSSTGFFSEFAGIDVPTKLDAEEVAAYVKANAGPLGLAASPVESATSSIQPTTTFVSSTSNPAATTVSSKATPTSDLPGAPSTTLISSMRVSSVRVPVSSEISPTSTTRNEDTGCTTPPVVTVTAKETITVTVMEDAQRPIYSAYV